MKSARELQATQNLTMKLIYFNIFATLFPNRGLFTNIKDCIVFREKSVQV